MVNWLFEILGYLLGDILTETRLGRIFVGLAIIVGCGVGVYALIQLVSR